MKTVFMGSPGFAVPFLEALLSSPHDVACVFTQPDRARAEAGASLNSGQGIGRSQ